MSIRSTGGNNGLQPPITPSGDGDSDSVQSSNSSSSGVLGDHTISSQGEPQGLCVRIMNLFRNLFSGTRDAPAPTTRRLDASDIHHPSLSGQGATPIVSTGDKKVDEVIVQADIRTQNKQTIATYIQNKLKGLEGQSPSGYKASVYESMRYAMFTPGGTSVNSERARQVCIQGRDLWQQAAEDLASNENSDGLMMLSCLVLGGKHLPPGQLRSFMETVKGTFSDEADPADPTADDVIALAGQIDAAEQSNPGSAISILNYIGNCGKSALDNKEMKQLILGDQDGHDLQSIQHNAQEISKLLDYALETDSEVYLQTLTTVASDLFFEGGESTTDPFDY
ncbi:MAG: hypothetical protein IJ490_03290 [Chlamydia sp.]|nr:hypothetical protein [Chlamydia sp.]